MGGIQGSLKFAGLAAYSSKNNHAVRVIGRRIAKEEVYHLMYWL
jgi:hypothetical protein